MQNPINRLTRWLGKQPYTKAMYLTALATIVMATMSAIMCYTIVQNRTSLELTRKSVAQSQEALDFTKRSLHLTQDSVALQEREFRLRNRPFIVILNYKFSGEDKDSGGKPWPHTVEFEIVNISDVPANSVAGMAKGFLNDKEIISTTIIPAAISKAGSTKMRMLLSEEAYAAATNEVNKFEIHAKITYGGMLGESADTYCTEEVVVYSSTTGGFKYQDRQSTTYR